MTVVEPGSRAAALERWREATRAALLAGASADDLAALLQAEAEKYRRGAGRDRFLESCRPSWST